MVRDVIIERLMRRWIAGGTQATYDACARLLAAIPLSSSGGEGRGEEAL